MERGRRQYAEDSAVPVSSMIDIVFLLIIFFVLWKCTFFLHVTMVNRN